MSIFSKISTHYYYVTLFLKRKIVIVVFECTKTLSELTKTLTIKCDTEIGEDKIAYSCQDSDDSDCSVNLSLLLTTQNPARIDVRTLRKNKVSGWQGWCQQLSKYWEINKQ